MRYYVLVMKCNLCPRGCNVYRSGKTGFCKTDNITVSRISKHMWEEPCISGDRGSGTVFFAGCNLHCRFCQNYDISAVPHGAELTVERLADVMLYLQDLNAANVNLVTPSHFADKIAKSIALVKHRLHIPVVYNTGSYEKAEVLRTLEGLVDVYLPDLKFYGKSVSLKYASAEDYFDVAVQAILEMRRQQPINVFDAEGYIKHGVIVRHLVLPANTEDSKRIMDWIANTDKSLYVSVMCQYFAARRDDKNPELNRTLYRREYQNVLDYFENLGLYNGYCQDYSSATRDYLPDFNEAELNKLLNDIPHYTM